MTAPRLNRRPLPPPYAGGQGRTSDDIENTGASLWTSAAIAVVLLACGAVWAGVLWVLGVVQ